MDQPVDITKQGTVDCNQTADCVKYYCPNCVYCKTYYTDHDTGEPVRAICELKCACKNYARKKKTE